MDKSNSISGYYVRALVEGAAREGVNLSNALTKCGIAPDLLSNESGYRDLPRVKTEKVSALIREVWRLLDDEFMGFTADVCKQGVFGIIAAQVITKKTLGEALACACYLYSTLRNDICLSYIAGTDGARLTIELSKPELDKSHFLLEFFLLIWHRFSSWLVAERVPLRRVYLDYPSPEHVDEYSLLFPCHCVFNSRSNALLFELDSMALPVKQGVTELNRFLINSPTDLLSKPNFKRSLTTQVMNQVVDQNNRFRSLEECADLFNMSPRNLRRRLADEDNSFADIKQTLRMERAISLLSDRSLSIADVGQQLGFFENASFSRAFKKWTGLSPRLYRDQYSS